ncbi:MAG: hypothetical protein LAO30_23715 [Acidobacteriia bacterium]|nr:hypothetical protein [Terriglobia bacterium]
MRAYLGTLEEFRLYAQKRLDHLGLNDLRRYQAHLLEDKKLYKAPLFRRGGHRCL